LQIDLCYFGMAKRTPWSLIHYRISFM
jgi:hypothetical protein